LKLDLDALRLFVRASERGSISAAARDLGWLPATASAALLRAERELGGALFVRTTRNLKPTPGGERFLERARQALALLDDGRDLVQSEARAVTGLIRLTAPVDIGEQVVMPALDAFLELHPGVQLALQLSDQTRDLGRDDVDAAIRYGALRGGELLARRLADTRRVLVAAPRYLERRGAPSSVADLAGHECILLRTAARRPDRWDLVVAGRRVEVAVAGRRLSDSGALTRRWALAGHGITMKAWIDVCDDVASGRLVHLLPAVASGSYPLTLVMAPGAHRARRMRALGDWLAERFADRARRHPLSNHD
jgi:DNA-binding transcriptional LysR family regulator